MCPWARGDLASVIDAGNPGRSIHLRDDARLAAAAVPDPDGYPAGQGGGNGRGTARRTPISTIGHPRPPGGPGRQVAARRGGDRARPTSPQLAQTLAHLTKRAPGDVTTQHEELTAVAAACRERLALDYFDPETGPYPAEVMRTAWERAQLEMGGEL